MLDFVDEVILLTTILGNDLFLIVSINLEYNFRTQYDFDSVHYTPGIL